jgi:cation:H+ antiporter
MDALLLLVGGLVGLAIGGEMLVRGASRLAAAAGVSPLVVGLTVVAFGTSAPELAVSLSAVLEGTPDIAVANVVGSNIFNVLFILGLCGVIAPLVVAQRLVRLEVPLMIGVSFVALLAALDHRLARWEGVALVAGLVAYVGWAIRDSRRESAAVREEYAGEFGERGTGPFAGRPRGVAWVLDLALVVGGLVVLVIGARAFVKGAIVLARAMGVDEVVIGLTVVAAGTSLPEVAASLIATLRGERDIAIGNVVGSNLFNLLGILGLCAVVAPGGLPVAQSILRFDLVVMIAVAAVCLPLFFTGRRIDRWEAALFLAAYVAYTAYLVLDSGDHAALPAYSFVLAAFVLPPVAVTIGVVTAREWRGLRARRSHD